VEGLKEAGAEVATFNFNDRLIFYSKALLMSVDEEGNDALDDTGHPMVHQAMSQDAAFMLAMQGISHSLYTFWPDVVLFVSGFFVQAGLLDVVRKRNHKIVMLNTESPYQEDAQLTRGQFAHLVMLNDPANLHLYDEWGIKALYMPHAYRPGVHYPSNHKLSAPPIDLTFIGTAFKSRIEFFERMDFRDIDFVLAGNDWGKLPETSPLVPYVATGLGEADCVRNPDTAELYRGTKMGINFYRRESEDEHVDDIAVAMGPREVEMAAIGLPFLRDPREEGDKVLHMLPTFASPEDASEQLRWWLSHDAERAEAARLARAAIADRTFANNAKRMLRALDDL
jgi:spore maturation protein CgeB